MDAKISKFLILLSALLMGTFMPFSAHAVTGTDVDPGDACSVEDAVMMTANDSGNGGYILTCESGQWVATMNASLPTANEQVATKEYVDTVAAAGGGDNGRFQTTCAGIGTTNYTLCIITDTQTGQTSCRFTSQAWSSSNPWTACNAGTSLGVTNLSGSSITTAESGGNGYVVNAYGWGHASYNGDGETSTHNLTPTAIDLNLTFTKIVAGREFGCGIASSKPYCWSASPAAEDISAIGYPSVTDIEVGHTKRAMRLSTGQWHGLRNTETSAQYYVFGSTSTVASAGSVAKWYDSGNTLVDLPNDFTKLAFGTEHMCALRSNGNIHCATRQTASNNAYRTLGDGPVVGSYSTHTCAGSAHVVYYNTNRLAEDCIVSGGYTFTDVAVSAGTANNGTATSCGLANDGNIYCWGYSNANGYLGKGDLVNGDGTPTAVDKSASGAVTFAKVYGNNIDTSYPHFCALDTNDKAYCWGYNTTGQLGTGDTTRRTKPTPVLGNYEFDELSLGDDHTCGMTTTGALYCWGNGGSGRLGYGSTSSKLIPEPVSGGTGYVGIAAGSQNTYGWK